MKVAKTEGAVGFMLGRGEGSSVDGSVVGRYEGRRVVGISDGSKEGAEEG